MSAIARRAGYFLECPSREIMVTLLDSSGLAAALSIRVRSTTAAVVMEQAALLLSMTALDDVEQSWQGHLARASKAGDNAALDGLLEEMLGADVLLRTWAGFVASSVDAGRRPLRPQTAASILTRMLLQQRKRLLTTVIESRLDYESLQRLDRHRRVCERWSDVLLSVFPATSTTRALQFDPRRSADFAELWPAPALCSTRSADPVVVTAMRSALPPLSLADCPRKEAWTKLAEAVTAALHYDRRTVWTAVQQQG